jgi:predicted dehydrogenase
MKIIFIGLGSIGRRHALLLQTDFNHQLFTLRSKSNSPTPDGITEIHSWDEIDLIKPDIAFITNPTHYHIQTAIKCAEKGMHLFVEKPIGDSLEGLDELIRVVNSNNCTAYIAYNLRFHPLIEKVKEILEGQEILHARFVCASYYPSWRPGSDHLSSYSAHKDQGGGVLLDLSHEIDYCNYLLGEISEISGRFGCTRTVTVDAEDFADLIILHTSGIYSLIHLNLFSKAEKRHFDIETKELSISADLINGDLNVSGKQSLSFHYNVDRDTTYRKQLSYFFENIENPNIMNSLNSASCLFRKIINFRESR